MQRLHFQALFVLALVIGQWTALGQDSGDQSDDSGKGSTCSIDPEEVDKLFYEVRNVAEDRKAIGQRIYNDGNFIRDDEKIADISVVRQKNKDAVNRINELNQLFFEAVTDKLIEKHNLSAKQINECLPEESLTGKYASMYRNQCLETAQDEFSGPCNASDPLRTFDGTCNNLQHPSWGSSGVCLVRIAPPRYEGAAGFRQSVEGGPLPQPRDLSLNVHKHMDKPTTDINHLFQFFGQFVDHEFTQAPISVITDKIVPIKCCQPGELHPQCIQMPLRDDDPFFSTIGQTCLNMVRASACATCELGPRQQVNQITAFVDMSPVYGGTKEESDFLRTNDGTGRLRVQKTPYGDLVPPQPDPKTDRCSFPETNDICFKAGDVRSNEHPPGSSLHTIFLREHNRLADGLRDLNPLWNGERIFQTSRRIMAAQFTNIIYGEFLPITIGNKCMEKYQIKISQTKRTEYEPTTNPNIINEFNGAAFRFGHSLINSVLFSEPLNSTGGKQLLRDRYFQGFEIQKGILSPLMKSLITDSPAQSFDRHLVPDVTNFLYRVRGTPAGIDLASMNIQRGRDQGLPTYVDMVKHCSGDDIEDFDALVSGGHMTDGNAKLLSENYKNVKDVDQWTGLLSEIPMEGAIVGPTAGCIIGQQFHNTKFGDRFFFEHRNQIGSLTYRQLQDVKKMSLMKLICLNTDIEELPQEALLFPSDSNPMVKCSTIQGVNLDLWS